MKTITDDPEGFFEQGGWTFLDADSGSEGENEDEESEEDEAYEPTDVESDEESEEDSEYSEASEDDSEDSEGESSFFRYKCEVYLPVFCYTELGSDEESGKDWSDLEREAAEEDRNQEYTGEKPNGKTYETKKHSKSSKNR